MRHFRSRHFAPRLALTRQFRGPTSTTGSVGGAPGLEWLLLRGGQARVRVKVEREPGAEDEELLIFIGAIV